jgi:hypothetical protein
MDEESAIEGYRRWMQEEKEQREQVSSQGQRRGGWRGKATLQISRVSQEHHARHYSLDQLLYGIEVEKTKNHTDIFMSILGWGL